MIESWSMVKQFEEGKAVADARRASLTKEQEALIPKGEFNPKKITIPAELREREPDEVVREVQGMMFRESAYALGKSVWDDAGYNDIGYRTQAGVAPAVGWHAAKIERDLDYSWEEEEAKRIKEILESKSHQEYWSKNPEDEKVKKPKYQKKLALYEAKLPKYKVSEAWGAKEEKIIARPKGEFKALVEYLQGRLTEEEKSVYYGQMSEAVKNLAARVAVEKAYQGRREYNTIDEAELAVASELAEGSGGMHRMMFEMGRGRSHEGGVEHEKLRELLIAKLSERYAAYQHLAKAVFGKEVMMPLTDLQDLAHIRRDRPSFYERDTDVTGGRIGALAELKWPEGVSNLFEALRRVSKAESAVYLYRLLKAKPDLKIPREILNEGFGGGYGRFHTMTDSFEKISGKIEMGSQETLSLEDVEAVLQEQGATVQLILEREQKK